MQLIAVGKWLKTEKRWKTVVALRRTASGASRSPLSQSEPGKVLRLRPRRHSDS
jgi:hypothetical protein